MQNPRPPNAPQPKPAGAAAAPNHANAPSYFVDQRKGEVNEMKALLRNINVEKDAKRKRDIIKKVIAYMTLGIDVSRLFTEMIMAIETKDLVVKKMVYHYLCTYAHKNPEMSIMCINTLQRDCKDEDPMVRGLALRSLCSLRLPSVVEYISEPLQKSLTDINAYVRKTGVMGILKLYRLDPNMVKGTSLIDTLYKMLQDHDQQVVCNSVVVLEEILSTSTNSGGVGENGENGENGDDGFNGGGEGEGDGMVLTEGIVAHLVGRVRDGHFNEWNLGTILRTISKYRPNTEEEVFALMNILDPLLRLSNADVVLGTVKMFLALTRTRPEMHWQVYERIKAPCLTLLSSSSPELSLVVLQHLLLLVQNGPPDASASTSTCCCFSSDASYKHFYLRFNEPTYAKYIKVALLVSVCNGSNVVEIAQELSNYVTDIRNVEVALRSVRALGLIAIKLPPLPPPTTPPPPPPAAFAGGDVGGSSGTAAVPLPLPLPLPLPSYYSVEILKRLVRLLHELPYEQQLLRTEVVGCVCDLLRRFCLNTNTNSSNNSNSSNNAHSGDAGDGATSGGGGGEDCRSVVLPMLLPYLRRWMAHTESPQALANMLWIIGEFGEFLLESPYILEQMIDDYHLLDNQIVKMQLLTATVTLFFKRVPECQTMLGRLFSAAINEEASHIAPTPTPTPSPASVAQDGSGGGLDGSGGGGGVGRIFSDQDVRDRALFYYRLMRTNPMALKKVITATAIATTTANKSIPILPTVGASFAEDEEGYDLLKKHQQLGTPTPTPAVVGARDIIFGEEFNTLSVSFAQPSFAFLEPSFILRNNPTLDPNDFQHLHNLHNHHLDEEKEKGQQQEQEQAQQQPQAISSTSSAMEPSANGVAQPAGIQDVDLSGNGNQYQCQYEQASASASAVSAAAAPSPLVVPTVDLLDFGLDSGSGSGSGGGGGSHNGSNSNQEGCCSVAAPPLSLADQPTIDTKLFQSSWRSLPESRRWSGDLASIAATGILQAGDGDGGTRLQQGLSTAAVERHLLAYKVFTMASGDLPVMVEPAASAAGAGVLKKMKFFLYAKEDGVALPLPGASVSTSGVSNLLYLIEAVLSVTAEESAKLDLTIKVKCDGGGADASASADGAADADADAASTRAQMVCDLITGVMGE